ncbi:MAG: hypothetical protein ACPLQP_11090, partial [Moorellaceae bacterium]
MSTKIIPPKPPKCAVQPEDIPTELKELKRWITWRYEFRGNRWAKVPCNANGNRINHLDSRNWLTFDQAFEAYQKGCADGLGIVLGHNLGGLDLDNCVRPDGTVYQWAKGLLRLIPATYAETSPSGKGLKLFFHSQSTVGRRKGSVELYTHKRFFTVTGKRLPEAPGELREMPEKVVHTLAENLDLVNLAAEIENGKFGPQLQELFEGCWSDYPSPSEADLAFISLLVHRCGVNNPEALDFLARLSGLYRPKWDER